MVDKRIQLTEIKFGISGMEEVYKHQKKLLDLAEENLRIAQEHQALVAGDKELSVQAAEAVKANLKAVAQYNKLLEDSKKSVAELIRVLSAPENYGINVINKSIKAVEKGLKSINNFYDENGNLDIIKKERFEGLATVLGQLKGIVASYNSGVRDMTEGLHDNQTAYNELISIIKNYETNGRQVASMAENQAEAYRLMGVKATEAKVRIAELDGVVSEIGEGLGNKQLEDMRRFYDGMSRYAGASVNQVENFVQKVAEIDSELAKRYGESLQDPSRYSAKEIQDAVKWMEEYKNRTVLSAEAQKEINASLIQAREYLKEMSGASMYGEGSAMWEKMNEQFRQLTSISRSALEEQQKYWEGVSKSAESGSNAYQAALSRLAIINKELSNRNELEQALADRAMQSEKMDVLRNVAGSSVKEIEDAVKWMEEYTRKVNLSKEAQAEVTGEIFRAKEYLKELSQADRYGSGSMTWKLMSDKMSDLTALSKSALDEQQKYWDGALRSAKFAGEEYDKIQEKLWAINDEMVRRKKLDREAEDASLVSVYGGALKNPSSVSVKEIEDAVKWMEEYKNRTVLSAEAQKEINASLIQAREYLKEMSGASMYGEGSAMWEKMDEQFGNLSRLSLDALKEQKKYWEAVASSADTASSSYNTASRRLGEVEERLKKVNAANESYLLQTAYHSAKERLDAPSKYSLSELEEAYKTMQKVSREARLDAEAQKEIYMWIEKGRRALEAYDRGAQTKVYDIMIGKMQNMRNQTDASLKEMKAFWEKIRSTSETGDKLFAESNQNIALVESAMRARQAQQAINVGNVKIDEVLSEQGIPKNMKEIESAIKTVKEYLKSVSLDDVDSIKKGNEALMKLTEAMSALNQQAQQGKGHLDQYRQDSAAWIDKMKEGTNASDALKRAKDSLEAYKRSLGTADSDKLSDITKALSEIDKAQRQVESSSIDWGQYKGSDLSKRSLAELKQAYEVLRKEIETMSPAQDEYNSKAMQMQQIDKQVKKLDNSMKSVNSSMSKAIKRLSNYVVVYLGFNKAVDHLKSQTSDILELSDKMANVQKVTGMSADESARLVDNIQKIDTRTATLALMDYAEQAGKLGIYTKYGVQGMKQFVEMGDMIGKTLGEDIGGAKAIADLAKVNDILHVTSAVMHRTGNEANAMRDALDATGSAILNVGNNSAASYDAMVQYVGRMGATAASTHLTMTETIALAGALDALKMPAEAGATALSQFINYMRHNSDAMAKAAKIATDDFRELIQGGRTFEAFQLLMSRVADGTTNAQELMNAMTGRTKSNVNVRNVINLLSGNMDLLNEQLKLAKTGFDSAFGDKTARDIALIRTAMKDMGLEGSLQDLESLYMKIKAGTYSIGTSAEYLAKSGNDYDMLRSAIDNVVVSMDGLMVAGKLDEEGLRSLAMSTGTASVMQREFAVVNETAAAKTDKLAKSLKDLVVNSTTVKWFDGVLDGLIDMIQWMGSGSTSARLFNATLVGLTTALLAVQLRLQEIIAVRIVGWFRSQIELWSGLVKQMGLARAAGTAALGAFHRIKAFFMTNWVTIAIAAIAALVYWFKSVKEESEKFADAVNRASESLDKETRQAALLFAQLKNLNLTTAERASLFNTINQRYGTMLGFMVSEKTSAQELANAYELINAKLREKAKLQLQEQLLKEVTDGYSEKIGDAVKLIAKHADYTFRDSPQASAEVQTRIMAMVQKQLVNNPDSSPYFGKALKEIINTASTKYLGHGYDERTMGSVEAWNYAAKSLFDLQKQMMQAQERVSRYIAGRDTAERQQGNEAYAERVRIVKSKVGDAVKSFRDDRSSLTDEELDMAIREMQTVVNDKQLRNSLRVGGAEDRTVKSFVQLISDMRDVVTDRLKLTPWGDMSTKDKPYEQWTVDQLAAYREKLNAAHRAATSRNAKWTKIFPDLEMLNDDMSQEEVMKILDEEDEKVKKIIEDKHQGMTFWDHPTDKKNRTKKDIEDLMDATLAKLEEYYQRRATMAEQAYNAGRVGEDEYNRYIFANEQEHLEERQNLRKKWLDTEHQFATQGVKELMQGIDFGKISKFLHGMGRNMVDGIKLNIAKDETEVQKRIRESREKIEKTLMEQKPMAKVANDFLHDMASLGVIYGNANEAILHTGEEALKDMVTKVDFLMKEAMKGYALTSESMLKSMQESGNPVLSAWHQWLVKDENKEALDALVVKTQSFYDQYQDAVSKMTEKFKKRWKAEEKSKNDIPNIGSILDGSGTTAEKIRAIDSAIGKTSVTHQKDYYADKYAEKAGMRSMVEGWGFSGYDSSGMQSSERIKLEALEQELKLNKELLAVEMQRIGAEIESKKVAADSMQDGDARKQSLLQEVEALRAVQTTIKDELTTDILSTESKIYEMQRSFMSKTVEMVKPYYDDLNSFAQSFGESIFGSKEDRVQASRELMQSLIKTTGQMLTQWLVYYTTKKYLDKMEEANELAKQQRMLAAKIAANAAALKAEGALRLADIQAQQAQSLVNAAAAQQKEAAKAGWIGWAIGAGLSLLMTTIFSSIASKAKAQVSAATGASGGSGKLVTGMLTYASGRYPAYSDGRVEVKGNDGKVYNAVYKPHLGTGEVSEPHLGIVGEDGAELVVDSPTYKLLKDMRPDILNVIYAAHRYGRRAVDFDTAAARGQNVLRMRDGAPTYKDGRVEPVAAVQAESNDRLTVVLERLGDVIEVMEERGLPVSIDMYRLKEQELKADKFLKKMGKI